MVRHDDPCVIGLAFGIAGHVAHGFEAPNMPLGERISRGGIMAQMRVDSVAPISGLDDRVMAIGMLVDETMLDDAPRQRPSIERGGIVDRLIGAPPLR